VVGIPKDNDAVEIWQKLFATVGLDAKEGEIFISRQEKLVE
jgi:hypothetical protein